ncbi:hypothetical protein CT0861_05605 [Colletotrichum tofieldiae]|uniref:Uncharacterized protein n=1 Tax=Colletotrichum tofieldiae TaxID=708197 RepID=A0A161YM81_9PEZI|nr:hypothetical protein CT0861_05605 [Colletotrichum tofieldiae]
MLVPDPSWPKDKTKTGPPRSARQRCARRDKDASQSQGGGFLGDRGVDSRDIAPVSLALPAAETRICSTSAQLDGVSAMPFYALLSPISHTYEPVSVCLRRTPPAEGDPFFEGLTGETSWKSVDGGGG